MNQDELQAWADRMSVALEEIAERMDAYIESGGEAEYAPTPERIRDIANRALNREEWERAS